MQRYRCSDIMNDVITLIGMCASGASMGSEQVLQSESPAGKCHEECWRSDGNRKELGRGIPEGTEDDE